VKDRASFPMFNPELAAAMTEESRLLVADASLERSRLHDDIQSDYGFLNSDLANLYKFPALQPNSSASSSQPIQTAPGCWARLRSWP